MDFGFLSFIFYTTILLLPIFLGYFKYKKYKDEIYPFLIGYAMLLIANATNPYFGKLDYLNVYLLIFIKLYEVSCYDNEKNKILHTSNI